MCVFLFIYILNFFLNIFLFEWSILFYVFFFTVLSFYINKYITSNECWYKHIYSIHQHYHVRPNHWMKIAMYVLHYVLWTKSINTQHNIFIYISPAKSKIKSSIIWKRTSQTIRPCCPGTKLKRINIVLWKIYIYMDRSVIQLWINREKIIIYVNKI